MANLLSDGDWQEFSNAIRDTTDTFFLHEIVLTRYAQERSLFNEDKDSDTVATDYNLVCLIVPAKTGNDAENQRRTRGSLDLSEGYILFNKDYLREEGLVDANNNVLINSNVDTIVFQGKKINLTGHEEVGPTKNLELQTGGYELFKVHFKRIIKENSVNNLGQG